MNWKKFSFILICLIFSSTIVFAQIAPFTPVIDGVKDSDWGDTPTDTTYTTREPVSLNLEEGCYVTDDSAFIYIGVPTDNDPWDDGNPIHFHVAFDVNNTTAGGTSDAWGSSITYGQTYLPDYDIITQWSTSDQSVGWTGFENWNGSGWDQTQLNTEYIAGGGDSFTEIAVPRLWLQSIEAGDTMNFSLWLRPDAGTKPNASSCLPQDDSFPTDYGNAPAGTFTTSFSYTVQTTLIDVIRPTVQSADYISSQKVDIIFSEGMDSTSATNTTYYEIDNGVTVNSIDKIADNQYRLQTSGFTSGTDYTVTVDTLVTDIAGNHLDPAQNTADFTAIEYATIIFIVDDSAGEIYSGFYLKGSWDANGYYDSGWGGGVEHSPFYDDGTHGDETPNDHVYTVEMQLVVDDSANTWEWGVNDSNHNWIDGNWQFWIPDGDPQTLTYVVPYGTTQDVTVTFQVDMSLEDNVDSVFIAGDFNGWNPAVTQMSDINSDDIYTYDHTFPQNSNYEQEFKYIKNDGEWESFYGNRSFTINDSNTTQILQPVYFNYLNPTHLQSISFLDSTQSDYTNFADGDIMAMGDSLFFETKMSPADSNGNSGYWSKLNYEIDDTWYEKDFGWSNNYAGASFWHAVLENGVDVNDGDSINFYVQGSDFNGPVLVDDNSGDYYQVSIEAPPLPEADFVADTTQGPQPLTIQFTDLSTNNPNTWSWDFGDGSTSAEQNPSHTYSQQGYYTVSLTVSNAYGEDTEVKTDYIHVTEPLIPPTNLTAEVVNYFDVQLDWDAPAKQAKDLEFYRVYKDGAVDVLVYPPTTAYLDQDLAVGSYEYFVTANYPGGESEPTDTVAVNVNDPYPNVVAAHQVSNEKVEIKYSTIMDSVSATDSGNYTFSPALTVNEVIKVADSAYCLETTGFTSGLEYTITVDSTVTDINGYAIDPMHNSASFTAVEYAPITFIVDDSAGELYEGFYLKGSWNRYGFYDPDWGGGIEHTAFYDDGTHGDDTPNDHIYTVEVPLAPDDSAHTWLWGVNDSNHEWVDGNWSFWLPDADPQTLTYEVPYGTSQDVIVTFQVDMSLEDDVDSVFVAGGFNGWSANANELSDPNGDDIYTGEHTFPEHSMENQEYKFVKNDGEWEGFSGNRSFTIDDSDSTQILEPVYFGYLNPTELQSVTFLDSTQSGYTNFVSGAVVNLDENLKIETELSPADSNANSGYWAKLHYGIDGTWYEKDFNWNNNYNGDSYWRVELINGTDVYNGDFINFYVEASDYNGPVLVDDNDGDYYEVSLETPPAPIADFTADTTQGMEPLEVNFTDLSTNSPDTWSWDFGDGGTSSVQNPSHTYQDVGYFTVTLTVSNAGGTDTETKTNYIDVTESLDPPADFTAEIVNYFNVEASWNPPERAVREVQFYRLYRNGSVQALIYHPSTNYLDEDVAVGNYEYYVTAQYAAGESTPSDTVNIEIVNLPPVAEAGPNQTVDEEEFVTLDGSGSYDPEEQGLDYNWSTPPEITLSDTTIVDPTFTAPVVNEDTVFPITLVVNDGYQNSEPDTVYIEVIDLYGTEENDMPAVTTLFQNYPNPVKNGTTIKFALTKPGFVSLKVYNVKGEKVTTFLQNNLEEAIHTVNWNIADSKKKLPNGIYFYELQTPQKIITKKMIIMK